MSVNDWIEAFRSFLIAPLNQASIASLVTQVPFETICACCIHPDASESLREEAQRVVMRFVTYQPMSNEYIQKPFAQLLLGSSDEPSQKLFNFMKALVNHEDAENKFLLKPVLGQVIQVISISSALSKHNSSMMHLNVQIIDQLLHEIMLPMFDHDQLSFSEVVSHSMKRGIKGEVLHCLTMPSSMGIENDHVEALAKKWHKQEMSISEMDDFADWILSIGLINELKDRLVGKAKLTAGAQSSSVDVVKVRAGSLLIQLCDICAKCLRQAEQEGISRVR
eukprot:Gregarina_sp_Poly_1__5091@NODE_269_length_10312_cov_190_473011_g234_i0_p5_GENE_NODE_269_length_10312_cov_190_473011_g234_i0NODE_269_length_10312_cov_190_473011_g234_i0_p5_ORF_typecomplete_len279_score42_28DUF1462/PF07315_11/4DUF1462/PF07315_11/31Phage_int_SAM_2/PF12834_7/0_12DUF2688/PF10892_8/23DUF2688/PF10892_8/12_NODE_269_length_10312_cov_190_473011_g234_i0933210168